MDPTLSETLLPSPTGKSRAHRPARRPHHHHRGPARRPRGPAPAAASFGFGLALALASLALTTTTAAGEEVGFIETFALAPDRAAALEQLIPGTPDYYYYHALHLQNEGRYGEVDGVLKQWSNRQPRASQRYHEIEHRQALLRFGEDPGKTYGYLREQLKLRFDHRQETGEDVPDHPTRLQADRLGQEALRTYALEHQSNLKGFEDSALDWLVAQAGDLGPDRRRDLLSRLRRPDYPGLPALIVADLEHENSRGFGSHAVHQLLLLDQLDELLRLRPSLIGDDAFIRAYLNRQLPPEHVDWRHDPAAREAYLNRLWAFVRRLPPAQNSLKAHVLYHRLAHDRAAGKLDRGRFMEYLKLPRSAPYVNPDYLRQPEHRGRGANLGQNFGEATSLPPVGGDEPLVRAYLAAFLLKADNTTPFAPYLEEAYLKEVFAETKILNGAGERERWYSLLDDPAKYQRLKERVDLDFAPTNPAVFGAEEPVSLDLFVKNAGTLIVKVFEINALNYYKDTGREVTTDIQLDGLVANDEKTYTYPENPFLRVRRTFTFPGLARPGTFVVEFIGNGRSSRAVVRKGRLRFLERVGAAGHIFRVLDEGNAAVPNAALHLGGHIYRADRGGEIAVPFSSRPGRQPIVLTRGDGEVATLEFFQHRDERYDLAAAIHVDRESLLHDGEAKVVVRPSLTVHGERAPLELLREVTLTIASTDRDGIGSSQELRGFVLAAGEESVHTFTVPDRLAEISFTLSAKVKPVTRGGEDDLAASRTFQLNGAERTDRVDAWHLSSTAAGYVLSLLGKTGEARAGQAVRLTFKHRDFTKRHSIVLQTDARGRLELGPLTDIVQVAVDGSPQHWDLPEDRRTYPASVHGLAGIPLRIPFLGAAGGAPARRDASLIELRGGLFHADRFSHLSFQEGFLVADDLPPGTYDLYLKRTGARVTLRLVLGAAGPGFILGPTEHLQVRNPSPLHIESLVAEGDNLAIQLRNASSASRVHVFATRYLPAYHPYDGLLGPPAPEPLRVGLPRAASHYLEGRNIGDEYRYILERKLAQKFPGNLLRRPELILNPWAVRTTEAGRHVEKKGDEWKKEALEAERRASRSRARGGRGLGRGSDPAFAGLDFLADPSAVLLNLRPGDDGRVVVPLEKLGGKTQVHVVALDRDDTVHRSLSLPEAPLRALDLRLAAAFDPGAHLAEQKHVSLLQPGAPFVLENRRSADLEVYDSLTKIHQLFTTLTGDATLAEFAFVLRWPEMDAEERRATYSRYACHELNFFLWRRDPEFFRAVVAPHLANKRAPTFLDHFLLGADLSPYLAPWEHARLNAAERALLAARTGDRAAGARHLADLLELRPPDTARQNHLFFTALKTGALSGGGFGGGGARDRTLLERAPGAPPAPAAALARLAAPQRAAARPKAEASTAASADGAERAKGVIDRLAAKRKNLGEAPTDAATSGRRQLQQQGMREELRKLESLAEFVGEDESQERLAGDLKRRGEVRRLYTKMEKTRAWVENHYYQLPLGQQVADLVPVNAFWADYAARDPGAPFLSTHVAAAAGRFPEMLLALAVLDLPFTSPEHGVAKDGDRLTLTPGGRAICFHKQVQPAGERLPSPLLVSQNFFDPADRYRQVDGERVDKFVTGEFLVHRVYGCQVVLTNPASATAGVDVLLQVPEGAVPVSNGTYTKSHFLRLPSRGTHTFEYAFYFPRAGQKRHYPVHVSSEGRLVAAVEPFTFNVVPKLSEVDTGSWAHVSQRGSAAEVIAFLKENNVHRLDLSKIAWRMRDRGFFRQVTGLLAGRRAYDPTLWSYALHHGEAPAAREYLRHRDRFVGLCGDYLDSPLLVVDPVERRSYEHVEYSPLVNPRAHRFGARRKILNRDLHGHYHRLMKILGYRRALDGADRLAVTYYLLLQDRVAEALETFAGVDPGALNTTLQYDYFKAYLAFYEERPDLARAIAARYEDYPVDRWRARFAEVIQQADEIGGGGVPAPAEEDDRGAAQTQLAATEPGLDLEVEAGRVQLSYQNLPGVQVNYYSMDLELLFSRNPFVKEQSGQFAYIRPNHSAALELPPNRSQFAFDLPAGFRSSNVLVEVVGAGLRKAEAYFSNRLDLQLVENYGQLRVVHRETGKPVAGAYVKVYARTPGRGDRFYKDGYTDLRGRFDYASLNSDDIDAVERFALLVLSDQHGASVLEANPPKR